MSRERNQRSGVGKGNGKTINQLSSILDVDLDLEGRNGALVGASDDIVDADGLVVHSVVQGKITDQSGIEGSLVVSVVIRFDVGNSDHESGDKRVDLGASSADRSSALVEVETDGDDQSSLLLGPHDVLKGGSGAATEVSGEGSGSRSATSIASVRVGGDTVACGLNSTNNGLTVLGHRQRNAKLTSIILLAEIIEDDGSAKFSVASVSIQGEEEVQILHHAAGGASTSDGSNDGVCGVVCQGGEILEFNCAVDGGAISGSILEAKETKTVPETNDVGSIGTRDDGDGGDELGEARSANSAENGRVETRLSSLVVDSFEGVTDKWQASSSSRGVIFSHAQNLVNEKESEQIVREGVDIDRALSGHSDNSCADVGQTLVASATNDVQLRFKGRTSCSRVEQISIRGSQVLTILASSDIDECLNSYKTSSRRGTLTNGSNKNVAIQITH